MADRRCPAGHDVLAEYAFCQECGERVLADSAVPDDKPVEDAARAAEGSFRRCAEGHEVPAGYPFCPECGAPAADQQDMAAGNQGAAADATATARSSDASTEVICTNGHSVDGGDNFCRTCAAPVSAGDRSGRSGESGEQREGQRISAWVDRPRRLAGSSAFLLGGVMWVLLAAATSYLSVPTFLWYPIGVLIALFVVIRLGAVGDRELVMLGGFAVFMFASDLLTRTVAGKTLGYPEANPINPLVFVSSLGFIGIALAIHSYVDRGNRPQLLESLGLSRPADPARAALALLLVISVGYAVYAGATGPGDFTVVPRWAGGTEAVAEGDDEEDSPEFTPLGCVLERDYLGVDGVTSVDPSCTDGGVILRTCPVTADELLYDPVSFNSDSPTHTTTIYSTKTGNRIVVTKDFSSPSLYATVRCSDGTLTVFSIREWEEFEGRDLKLLERD